MKVTEEVLATRLLTWLQAQGWDCYPEVEIRNGGRVDIVAVRGSVLHAIEVKTSASLAVLEQAIAHRGKFHYVSVATPWTRSHAFQSICRVFGIGWFRINDAAEDMAQRPHTWSWNAPARVEIQPRLDRGAHAAALAIRARLSEQHKRFAPGNATCSYWTPFRNTCEQVLDQARRSPEGIPLRELVKRIKHHYASDATAVSCLRQWIQHGKVPGVIASGTPLLVRAIETERREVAG